MEHDMDELQITREQAAKATILRLNGPLRLNNLFTLQDALREIGEVNTIIDVTDCPYIDSAGLGTVLSHWTHTQGHGTKFALTGVSKRIGVLLELTHVDKILPIFPTADDALRSF
jgi:anti-sigma B factor antagonist